MTERRKRRTMNEDRKLATIKEIGRIYPIEGKDKIVLAEIDGWHVIVRKDDFQTGTKCVYCEIDSVLPEKPEFEFLRSKKFRIRTMRMAGVISEGICFPLSILPVKNDGSEYDIGEDVTDLIGIKHYEEDDQPECDHVADKKHKSWMMRFKWYRNLVAPKKTKGGFPTKYVQKTDEIRIQNCPWVLDGKTEWVATEKIDGQSGTFLLIRHKFLFWKRYEYIVCSRNMRLKSKDNSSYWKVSDKYNIQGALMNMIGDRDWIAIQGECVGPKIQKNKYNLTECDFYVFNLLYPTGRVDSESAANLVKTRGFNFVPIVDKSVVLPTSVEEVLAYAHGMSQIADTWREGIVFRSKDGKRSFKAVDPEFLMRWSE